ncbi:MAG: hypothetical protein RBU30_04505 [Polyangia bacterium]|jgi:hypothetical protein|nr:hypothetical protein [Polyangia bacterium]
MKRALATLLLILGLAWASCGDDGSSHGDAQVGSDGAAGQCTAPAAPVMPEIPVNIAASTAETVRSYRRWNLIGNALTQGEDTLAITLVAPSGAQCLDLWIGTAFVGRFPVEGAEQVLEADLSSLGPGRYQVLVAAVGGAVTMAIAQLDVFRSHPYYVLVTNDWDDSGKTPEIVEREELLHANHPHLKLTHFVGPYTFTDPALTTAEVDELVTWLLGMREQYGDEIGLHVHPYCHFVQTTAVPCRVSPSFVWAEDPEGYTVVLGSYTQAEAEILFQRAKDLFLGHGLGAPTSFRAGGWTAEIHTLAALAATGFVADSSALNWSRLEEWQGVGTATLYEWNQSHWATIDATSQPYYPSAIDILDDSPPVLPILEVPDNGVMVDYVTDDEIVELFEANWPGEVLHRPTTYVTGYHPGSYLNYDRYMEDGLTAIDQFLHAEDAGPVIYETVSNMALVWPVPE